MISRGAVPILGVLLLACPAVGQETVTADSLVAEFLERGAFSSWIPYEIFSDCPMVSETHARAFDLLAGADLSRFQWERLTLAWTMSLRGCKDERLVDWFFDQVDEGIRSGSSNEGMGLVWKALADGSSPAIRDRLREYVLRSDVPEDVRASAGHAMFDPLDGPGRRAEFSHLFRTGVVPYELAIGLGMLMVHGDMEWTLRETLRAVTEQPDLADQPLFGQVMTSANQFAPQWLREEVASGLEAVAARGGARPGEASRLRETAAWLRKGRRNGA